jgi:hypothetical protein
VLLGTSEATASNRAVPPAGFTISGQDLHDGSMFQCNGVYYLTGTGYGCGFQWRLTSPFCGFGVSTAPSRTGPWSAPRLLFPPSELDPYSRETFDQLCSEATQGRDCFNPRLVRRASDGVWVLWFNAVAAQTSATNSAYYVMGCNGPAGPCGRGAGAPHGSTNRPVLHQCGGDNGDFTITASGTQAAIMCGNADRLAEESLDHNWANGTGTVYATAPSMLGPWTAPGDVGFAAPQTARRDISATSCGGQPRTVSIADGQPWQGIDLWTGARNEAGAGLRFEPLVYPAPPATPATAAPNSPSSNGPASSRSCRQEPGG